MRIHRLVLDLEQFAHLEPRDPDEFFAQFPFDGRPLPGSPDHYTLPPSLVVPEMNASPSHLPHPDIWSFCGSPRALAFSERARYALGPILDSVGQVFEFSFQGETLHGLNVTHCINGLDLERTVFDPGNPERVLHYEFYADRVGWSPFSVPETRFRELYSLEGVAARESEFKPVVEDEGLTGLKFELLWAGRDPEGRDADEFEDDEDDDYDLLDDDEE